MSRSCLLLVVLTITGAPWIAVRPACAKEPAGASDQENEKRVFFESKVLPILESQCFACHGPEKQKAGLRLDSRGAMMRGGDSGSILEPGDSKASRLIEVVRYQTDVQMPPRRKLDDGEIAVLSRWVESGAHWPSNAGETASVERLPPGRSLPTTARSGRSSRSGSLRFPRSKIPTGRKRHSTGLFWRSLKPED